MIERSFSYKMSPRTAIQNREVRAVTRAKLLNAALELFASRGYAATSVDAIAEAAGVSAGLLYHHFDSKAAVLNAIFEQSLADVQATFAAADREGEAARSITRAAALRARHRPAPSPVLGGVVRPADAAGGAEDARPLGGAIHRTRSCARSRVTSRTSSWPDAAIEARLLFAQIDGLCQHYVLDPAHYPLEHVIERLVERYAGGPRIMRIALTDGEMHYVDEGSGPPILFVHGTPTNSYEYRHLIAALSKRFRCIAPDHLGFGQSSRPQVVRLHAGSARGRAAGIRRAPRPRRTSRWSSTTSAVRSACRLQLGVRSGSGASSRDESSS